MRVVLLLACLLFSCAWASLDPYHVYLSITGDLTQMQLTFTTTFPPPSAVIQYYPVGNSSDKMEVQANPTDTIHFVTPAGRTEYITSVTLINLQPATEYTYTIACDSTQPPEKTYTLKTLPDVDDPINIAMYGDLGSEGALLITNGSGGINAWASARKMDMIIHYGDLAYNLATNNGDIGDLFMSNIENISTMMPYVVTAGNHEYMSNDADEALFRGWFRGQIPLGESSYSSDPGMWHSFDVGEKLHFIGINTEVYCEAPESLSPQWYWLAKDLAMVRSRSVQPWVIVYGHRQLYDGNSATYHQQMMRYGVQCTDFTYQNCSNTPCLSGENCAFSLEQLFQEYNIDLYIAGHQHFYNRMFPISSKLMYETQNNFTYINPQNPVYIISGAAGDLNHTVKAEQVRDSNLGPSVFYNTKNSFSLLTVYNNTYLQIQQVTIENTVEDELWIIKDPNQPKWPTLAPFTLQSVTSTECSQ